MPLDEKEKKLLDIKLKQILEESEAEIAKMPAVEGGIDPNWSLKKDLTESLDVLANAALQSATFNLSDEAIAKLTGATSEERRAVNEEMEAQRNKDKLRATAGLIGDIVGSVPGGAILGATKLGKLGAVGLGAVEGAISGAGGGEGGKGRVLGALTGAATGAALPAAIKKLVKPKTEQLELPLEEAAAGRAAPMAKRVSRTERLNQMQQRNIDIDKELDDILFKLEKNPNDKDLLKKREDLEIEKNNLILDATDLADKMSKTKIKPGIDEQLEELNKKILETQEAISKQKQFMAENSKPVTSVINEKHPAYKLFGYRTIETTTAPRGSKKKLDMLQSDLRRYQMQLEQALAQEYPTVSSATVKRAPKKGEMRRGSKGSESGSALPGSFDVPDSPYQRGLTERAYQKRIYDQAWKEFIDYKKQLRDPKTGQIDYLQTDVLSDKKFTKLEELAYKEEEKLNNLVREFPTAEELMKEYDFLDADLQKASLEGGKELDSALLARNNLVNWAETVAKKYPQILDSIPQTHILYEELNVAGKKAQQTESFTDLLRKLLGKKGGGGGEGGSNLPPAGGAPPQLPPAGGSSASAADEEALQRALDMQLTGNKPTFTIIKGGGEKIERPVRKNTFDIIDETVDGGEVKDKPISDQELINPDANKLLQQGNISALFGKTKQDVIPTEYIEDTALKQKLMQVEKAPEEQRVALELALEQQLEKTNTIENAMFAAAGGGGKEITRIGPKPARIPNVQAPTKEIARWTREADDKINDAAQYVRDYLTENQINPRESILGNAYDNDPILYELKDNLLEARKYAYKIKKDTLIEHYSDQKKYKYKPVVFIDPEYGSFTIEDPKAPEYRLMAMVDDLGTLSLTIKTKDIDSTGKLVKKSDILNADELIEQALWFLEPEIKQVKALWINSDLEPVGYAGLGQNNRMFNRAYNELLPLFGPQEAERLASRMTWTAEKLREFGYTVPKVVNKYIGKKGYETVTVMFKKPED